MKVEVLSRIRFALIGVPFVLAYTATIYYVFRGKVTLMEESY